MRTTLILAAILAFAFALELASPSTARACVAGDTCCMALPAGADVADIFHDKLGRTGTQLPAFGKLLNPARTTTCLGITVDPHTLGGYDCNGPAHTGSSDPHFYAEKLDHLWVQTFRTCADGTSPPDGTGGCYYPPNGLIYDLGGPSNKVVLFPMIDHGPLPQEAFEYSVYLSDNPAAIDVVPRGMPTDSKKWNEATLVKFFEKGWNPDPADVSDDDVTVWGLPCGITFRYLSIVPGNLGNPSAACVFHSSEYEIDAVAGLSEDETGICPDLDHDGHTDSKCGGDDCDDSDPAVHPGAPEPCDAAKDFNCDGKIGGCAGGLTCTMHVCLAACGGGEFPCPGDEMCLSGFCVASPCGNGPPCPPGKACDPATKMCVDPCTGAVCPSGKSCLDGHCVDLCAPIKCPMNQLCQAGLCVPSCACTGCPTSQSCDMASGRCVDTGCAGKACLPTELCAMGACVDACSVVKCPLGTTCAMGQCQGDPCFGRSCGAGRVCDPGTGMCLSTADMSPGPDLASPDAAATGTTDASASAGDQRGSTPVGASLEGGCGCRVGAGGAHEESNASPLLLALLALVVATGRLRAERSEVSAANNARKGAEAKRGLRAAVRSRRAARSRERRG